MHQETRASVRPIAPDEERARVLGTLEEARAALGALVEDLRAREGRLDQRWVSIGATHLQEGLMALRRAVERPAGF